LLCAGAALKENQDQKSVQSILTVTIPFFALMGCGYAAGRAKFLSQEGIDGMIVFVFYFALPCMLFRYMALSPLSEIADLGFMGAYAAVSFVVFAVAALGGRILFRSPLAVNALQGQAACVSNVGFLGLPLIAALLGPEAALGVVLVLLVDLVLVVPAAIMLIEVARHKDHALADALRKIAKGTLLNPFVLSIALGIAVSALGWRLPAPIDTFTKLLGAAAGPSALFALGASLAGRPLSQDFREAGYMIGWKLFLHPVVMWSAMTFVFDVKPIWATAVILVAALPVAGNVYIIAQTYGVYAARSSTAVLISTAIAVVTVSALVGILV